MSAKGDTFEQDLLKLIFQAVAIANIADNAGTGPLTSLYIGLHTADPGEAGNETTNECAYTNYARVAVARTTLGFSISGSTISNVGTISFPQCGATGSTATHFHVGTAASGTGKILYKGALTSQLVITNGITPEFAPGELDLGED